MPSNKVSFIKIQIHLILLLQIHSILLLRIHFSLLLQIHFIFITKYDLILTVYTPSYKMESTIRFQFHDEAGGVSLPTNAFGEHMNPSVLFPP